jgi:hypothetical protein
VTEAELARARRILEEIPGEHRQHQLSELLMELGRLPEVPDCAVLLPLVRHEWWDVRHDAIRALIAFPRTRLWETAGARGRFRC